MIIVVFILIFLFCVADAMQDTVAYHFDKSIFANLNKFYFDPSFSWVNKYKNGNPLEGEKFFGSTTFLVWLTDFWHLMKFIKMNVLCVAVSLCSFWWIYFVALFVYGFTFELIYRCCSKK